MGLHTQTDDLEILEKSSRRRRKAGSRRKPADGVDGGSRTWLGIASHLAAALIGVVLVSAWRWQTPGSAGSVAPMPVATVTPTVGGLDPVIAKPGEFSWSALPPPDFPIPPYARFLRGVRIAIDPGHIGQIDKGASWKRGPTGLREAEVNLRVSLFLREFLEAAGAEVIMTREKDVELGLSDPEDLRDRAEIANRHRVDLLLCIHHNAAERASANFTSVFYHAGPDHSPASQTAARYIMMGLGDALRLEQHIDSAVATDYTIYRDSGFGVLRHARVPAVLSEASFFSNPDEENRLRDPLYNRREAYGLFLGLARWAQAGLPRVRLLKPEDGRVGSTRTLLVALDDGVSGRGGFGANTPKIQPDTLVVKLNDEPVRHKANWVKRQLEVTIPKLTKPAELYIDFTTIYGQHVIHPRIELQP